jgi:hypothetical protein
MTRKQRIEQIESRLGKRKLVWFGTRGTDSRALLEISQFSEVFSIITPFGSPSLRLEVCLETLKGLRVDLELYGLDYDTSPEALDLRRYLFASLGEPAVVATYRPGSFFTSIYYPRSEFVEYLGLFHERQAPFEHKPWVESELNKLGVRIVPWRYFGDEEGQRLGEVLEQGPMVLRSSRSDGGAGLRLITAPDDVDKIWPVHHDSFIGAAPYLAPNIPLNVNACVFRDGSVSLHSPSLQLIGIEGFTNRTFGYCGNDFAQVRELDVEILDELERITRTTGKWLASMGYLGAFGIDAIVYDGKVYLTEVNPRFQGSSDVSAQLDKNLDRPDIFLEHLAAFLGLSPSRSMCLRDLVREQGKTSQVVCHNCRPHPTRRSARLVPKLGGISYMLLPASGVTVDPEAILFRAVIAGSVTEDGRSLSEQYKGQLLESVSRLFDNRSTTIGR